jgi:hypothetical protein
VVEIIELFTTTTPSPPQPPHPPQKKKVSFALAFLQVNVGTQRGFIPVDERMRVIDASGNLVRFEFLYEHIFPCVVLANCY